MTGLAFEPTFRSHVGPVRPRNEDTVFGSPRMVAVADGVGGHAAGEVASATAIGAIAQLDKCRLAEPLGRALERAVSSGNETIAFIASCRPRMAGMGTTLTAIALGGGRYRVANIGDSRAYLVRDQALARLTRDDTFVQELIDGGALTPAAAERHPQRSVVLEVLDGAPGRRPTITSTAARRGDRLLLCSDGLSDVVGDQRLLAALAIPARERCADSLLELALRGGAHDNVSAIVADVVETSDATATWIPALDLEGDGADA